MAGLVFVAGHRRDKAGTPVAIDASIEVRGEVHPFVSRGGLKLAAALETFQIHPRNWVAMDIGASTGGFTDCLLQNGAAKVYAVDVGYGQLDWSLRNDPRVIVLERTNARHLTKEHVPERVDLVVGDVSFIGLGKIFPAIVPLLKNDGFVVVLVKPQFEAGRAFVGKGGVVKDGAVHERVLKDVAEDAVANGLQPLAVRPSPITGPQGNVEYLLLAQKFATGVDPTALVEWPVLAAQAVEEGEPLRHGERQELPLPARNVARDSHDEQAYDEKDGEHDT